MKNLLVFLLLLGSYSVLAQITVPYNPDSNQDSFIGAPDLLDFLPLFGGAFFPDDVLIEGQVVSDYIGLLTDSLSAVNYDTIVMPMLSGTQRGQMLFWDGGQWSLVPVGSSGESLFIEDSVPVWKPARLGCTSEAYFEFNPVATINDGSCLTLIVAGCIDQEACNYNPSANDSDGSCVYPMDLYGVADVDCNGNCLDADGDGVCNEDEVVGCTNPASCNFAASATDDSGGCEGEVEISITYGSFAGSSTLSWSLYDENENVIVSGNIDNDFSTDVLPHACSSCYSLVVEPISGFEECLEDTCTALSYCMLSFGAGGVVLLSNGAALDTLVCAVGGCTDSDYLEFDSAANFDDGSCLTVAPEPPVDCSSPAPWPYYEVVQIGSQCWFAENLSESQYSESQYWSYEAIPRVTGNTDWQLLGIGGRCELDNLSGNADVYGFLYNGYAITTGEVCPTYYHVSTLNDWEILEQFVEDEGFEGSVAEALKSSSGWANEENGTDPFGLSLLPSGVRSHETGSFWGGGSNAEFWTASGGYVIVDSASPDLHFIGSGVLRDGRAVRCVRDF
ncbi:fibrobacter succinogenes major paralogous domain-containing protein [bacterium]|nr:fibrobacter succinogenes major paralogous domain-containing protein [bacterium]